MALGSFSSGALYEISHADIDRMLGLDETLFVEQKSGLSDSDSFKLLQAVAAFANTAGGWIVLGARGGKVVVGDESAWTQTDAPPLVDMVRDRIRGEIDPLPAFEAKVFTDYPAGRVGVLRVYESSDTPHVVLRNGAVYVREVAGLRDASVPRGSGTGRRHERTYKAQSISSRADLLQLAARGRQAEARVEQLLNTPRLSPLVARLGLEFHSVQTGFEPRATNGGLVAVRIAPYTRSPRFRGWATTDAAVERVFESAEALADRHGHTSEWLEPHPAGVSLQLPHSRPPHAVEPHVAAAQARVLIDGEGVAGASLTLDPPDPSRPLLQCMSVDEVASKLILPVIRAAAVVLEGGEFIGRSRCQIDLVGLQNVIRIDAQAEHRSIEAWVPHTSDITLTASEEELGDVATYAARALARSAGLRIWNRR